MPSALRQDLPTSPAHIAELARRHGLQVTPDSIRLNDVGLDYRVAYATTDQGEDWILRMPRRRGMGESITTEAAILDLVSGHLSVAVPQWQVANEDLIAYPKLPGSPGLTIDDQQQPTFHVDPASPAYAAGLGGLVAQLHAIEMDAVRAAGLPVVTIGQVRAKHREDLQQVAAAFTIDTDLLERWHRWLDTDSYWPTDTVFNHGELYQAHVLLDADETITGVLDWTTAAVGDPARDLALQYMSAPAEAFELTVASYRDAGGQTWPRLAEHCAELVAFFPVSYALYALTTGAPEHAEAAQAQLTPSTQR
ncbi:MAG TPA: macrolide 2'-phosphotransferase [Beutenbergiaceae bacterium]|nr:macrolide 2'-phosphotransferase [Beutenbergiaceae bacterium]